MDKVLSIEGVPIRLTEERWFHIVENHDDLAGHYADVLEAIADPDFIVTGYAGSLIAVRNFGRRKFLFAVYRQVTPNDGFVITAYFSSKVNAKKVIWRKS